MIVTSNDCGENKRKKNTKSLLVTISYAGKNNKTHFF